MLAGKKVSKSNWKSRYIIKKWQHWTLTTQELSCHNSYQPRINNIKRTPHSNAAPAIPPRYRHRRRRANATATAAAAALPPSLRYRCRCAATAVAATILPPLSLPPHCHHRHHITAASPWPPATNRLLCWTTVVVPTILRLERVDPLNRRLKDPTNGEGTIHRCRRSIRRHFFRCGVRKNRTQTNFDSAFKPSRRR